MIPVEPRGAGVAFPTLSGEQQAALVLDREVAVTAGAGAGKTTTLAARFVALHAAIVADRGETRPDAVLVLTFTDRAAEEMRERCYAMVGAVARAQGGNHRARMAWESLRDRFGAATISTFHSFCGRLLREYPAEAGVVPGYGLLDEHEASLLVGEAVEGALSSALNNRGGTRALLRAFGGRRALLGVLTDATTRRGELGPALRAHLGGPRPDLVAARCATTPAEVEATLRRLLPALDTVVAACAHADTPWLRTLTALRAAEPGPASDRAGWGRRLAAHLRGSSGGIRSLLHHTTTGAAAAWKGQGDRKLLLGPVQATLESLAPELDALAFAATAADDGLAALLPELASVWDDAVRRHRRALDRREKLDFTELIVRAAEVVAQPLVAAELQARHRYVMVDEFQDTDATQWAVVQALSRGAGAQDRLFFVGDTKQAIYGFRGGDVEVFELARRSVVAGGAACSLSINRRSRTELIHWFNEQFSEVLGPPGPTRPTWEAAYEPLAPGRGVTGGSVRWLVAGAAEPGGEDNAAIDGVEAEAERVAALLAEDVLAPGGAYAAESYGDLARHPGPPIAILLRRLTALRIWEAALRRRGVPFVVLGGRGFWARPEIVDVGNFLRAFTRGDPVARVAALRSPLFGLTDQDLVTLREAGLLASFPERAAALGARIGAAAARWAALERRAPHLSSAEVLQALLQGAHQPLQQAWLHPDGRSAANLRRLLEVADAHDLAGRSLADLADLLRANLDAAAREPEVPPARSAARVVVSTIHGAKGLEYPMVVVPELGVRRPATRAVGLCTTRREGGWEVAFAVPGAGAYDALERPGLLETLLARADAQAEAEYRRLYYVACTRARDHLVLVGPRAPREGASATWADHLVRWHEGRAEPAPWLVIDEERRAQTPPAGPPAALGPPPPQGPLAPIVARPRVVISPSTLDLAATDRPRWLREQVLGVRPLPSLGTAPPAVGSVLGTVLHGLLEDDALDDEALATRRWLAAAREAALPESEAGLPSLLAQCRALREDPTFLALFHRAHHRELGVRHEVGRLVLAGRMDLLCRDPQDAAWMVVDYKSSTGAPDPARHRLQLLAYSEAASRVLVAQGQPPVARAAIVHTRSATLARLPDWTDADRAELTAFLAELADDVERTLG